MTHQLRLTNSLVEELFLETQAHLGYFFEELDLQALSQIVDHLLASQGRVILSGVGKSGIIAKKVAATMNSCGAKAFFLSPLNALHGDLGMVSEQDTVLLFSKSGESDELLQLCPSLRNKGASLIAVVSSPNSRLAKACDRTIILPVAKELCPFDLAPTTSTVAQLLFGDLVSIALMRAKNVTIEEFVSNHPAGQIGKRLTLKVRDLMLRGDLLPLCKPDEQLGDILTELSNKRSGCLMVVDSDMTLLGIFTDGDLRRAIQKGGANALSERVSDHMTKNPKVTTADVLAYDALNSMEANQKGAITAMPVVAGDKLAGLIRLHDIVQSGV